MAGPPLCPSPSTTSPSNHGCSTGSRLVVARRARVPAARPGRWAKASRAPRAYSTTVDRARLVSSRTALTVVPRSGRRGRRGTAPPGCGTSARTPLPPPSTPRAIPSSITPPAASTTIRSAIRTVENRWLTSTAVRPLVTGRSVRRCRTRSGCPGTRRLVQHEHLAVAGERACQRELLPLPAGQFAASEPHAHLGVESVRQPLQQVRGTRAFCRGQQPGAVLAPVQCHEVAEADVVRGGELVAYEVLEEDAQLWRRSSRS